MLRCSTYFGVVLCVWQSSCYKHGGVSWCVGTGIFSLMMTADHGVWERVRSARWWKLMEIVGDRMLFLARSLRFWPFPKFGEKTLTQDGLNICITARYYTILRPGTGRIFVAVAHFQIPCLNCTTASPPRVRD